MVRTRSLRTQSARHDTPSTTARSVDEVALIRDTISHYAPVLIAPLSNPSRRRVGNFSGPRESVALCEYPGLSFQPSPVCACSLVSSLLLSGATMSQQSSLRNQLILSDKC